MSSTPELLSLGLPWQLAAQLGADAQTAVSAAGTTQATATAATGQFIEVGTAARIR